MQVDHFFANNYSQARQAFLEAASCVAADIETLHHPGTGPAGLPLSTDVALLGHKRADNVLLLISATHGVEGFAGSAIQVGLLRSGVAGWLKPNTRLVMIHALNPYGFACLRRCNEDNIDLNRNFIDHSLPPPQNQAYDQLAGFIAPAAFSSLAPLCATLRISWYRLCYGSARLQQVVSHGQYRHPQGLFYGGRSATWSNRCLHAIAERHLTGAARIVSIDFHTGLGPYAHGELILKEPVDDPAYRRATAWWGEARVKSTSAGQSVSADLCGTLNHALPAMLAAAEVTAVTLEFGTLPAISVFNALRAENWLYHHGGPDHPAAARIKERFVQAFYPCDSYWKSRVWAQGRVVAEQALAAL